MYSIQLRTILLSLIILTSSGCSTIGGLFTDDMVPPVVEIRTIEVKIPITHPVMPRAIDLKDPEFFVVSEKNVEEFMLDIKKRAGTLVFIAITVDDYELMSYNMQEIKRYVNQMKEVIVYYRAINDFGEEVETEPTTKQESVP